MSLSVLGGGYVPSIQRWSFDPMVRISLQDLGGIKSPSFSVSYIKAREYHFLLSSSQFIIFRAFQTSKLTNHQIVRRIFKKFSKILKNFEDQFPLQFT